MSAKQLFIHPPTLVVLFLVSCTKQKEGCREARMNPLSTLSCAKASIINYITSENVFLFFKTNN